MNEVKKIGFGNMDSERQRQVASSGGKAAHQKGTAHKWTTEAARAAAKKAAANRAARKTVA